MAAVWLTVPGWAQTAERNPPPVDEARLAARLVEMAKPTAGERAVIVYDPAYYPGITKHLREELQRRGVQTFTAVEDTPEMMAAYVDNGPAAKQRENEIVDSLRPLFLRSDIFYWMPARGYADDLRWERLVNESNVRSIHFHWLLRFPGARDADQIVRESREIERESLETNLAELASRQQRLAAALRGHQIRLTSSNGTDLQFRIPADQWFHMGDGDMSKARAEKARSIRDRQNELPPGMFGFVPDARLFNGVLVADRIPADGGEARRVTMRFENGVADRMEAESGLDLVQKRIRQIGPDGNKIGAMFLAGAGPLATRRGIGLDVGSNWEMGGSNRANGMRRMAIRLADATLTADGVTLMRNGEIQWSAIP